MSQFDANQRQAELKRDARLRRQILQALNAVRDPRSGWFRGQRLADVIGYASTHDGELDDQAHLLRLCDELEKSGYIEHRDDRHYQWQHHSASTLSYQITDQGLRLVNEASEPDPLIEDDRNQ